MFGRLQDQTLSPNIPKVIRLTILEEPDIVVASRGDGFIERRLGEGILQRQGHVRLPTAEEHLAEGHSPQHERLAWQAGRFDGDGVGAAGWCWAELGFPGGRGWALGEAAAEGALGLGVARSALRAVRCRQQRHNHEQRSSRAGFFISLAAH